MLKLFFLTHFSLEYFPRNKIFLVFFLLFFSINSSAAVILQYHHIGTSTPRSTSVTTAELRAHFDWLIKNNFRVLPLSEIIELVKNKQLNEYEKIASITFDDISPSICKEAWPILKDYQLPFTVFINTNLMPPDKPDNTKDIPNNNMQCSWEMLKIMLNSGLLSVGNHSQSHPHMLNIPRKKLFFDVQKNNKNEILNAQNIIDQTLGPQEKIFAYPYGEYNFETQKLITKLGYIGVGQQSGAIGNSSDLSALPRFPMSGQFANLSTLPDKLLSLPFPITKKINSENPIPENFSNTPELTLFFSENFSAKVQCFLGSGEKIMVMRGENFIFAKAQHIKKAERIRYNCTAPSKEAGRFYWYSYQWTFESSFESTFQNE